MVGAYGGGGGSRGALLPAPPVTSAGGKAVITRPPTRNTNGAKESDGPPVTVFIGLYFLPVLCTISIILK